MKRWWVLILTVVFAGCAKDGQLHEAKKNTVMVEVTSQVWDYRMPWNPGTVSSGRGAGFIVAGKKIITNAHVVSGARNITVQREADPRRYAARVQYVAHDCDLAMLEVEDDSFFRGTTPLD